MDTLIGIALNLSTALRSVDFFSELVLSICEHSILFHLFVLSSVSFINVLESSGYRSFTFLV